MKLLSKLRFLFLIAIASIVITSCGEDIGGGTGSSDTATSIDLLAGTDLVVSSATVPQGGSFTVNLVATAGTDLLNTLEVFEDGVSIDMLSRIKYDGVAAAANPKLLFNDDKSQIDVTIEVVAHSDVSTKNYRFTITDEGNDPASVSVDITTEGTPPSLTINGPSELTLAGGVTNNISLTGIKGSAILVSIGVEINDVAGDFADMKFDGVQCTSNPHLIGGDLSEGFNDVDFTIKTPTEDGVYVYKFILSDEFGLESTSEFTLNVVNATPLEVLEGVLFNKSGPTGTGGLDLDTGVGTGSSDANAEIIDQGNAGGVWQQLIAPVSDATMYQLTPGENGIAEGFTFSSIDSRETLIGLSQSGLPIGVSGTIQVGDMFVVNRAGNVYGILITQVNDVQADNSDNYVMTIVK